MKIRHRGVPVFFRVDPEDDRLADSIGNKVYLNESVEQLFGGIDRGESFLVDTSPQLRSVPVCREATLHAPGLDDESLAAALRSREYLLHPGIEEVADFDGQRIEFTVNDAEPADYTTLRVTDATELEFADEPDPSVNHSGGGAAGGARGSGGGQGGGQGGSGGEQGGREEVDIDITPKKPTKSFEDDVAGLETVKGTARTMLAMFDPEKQRAVEDRYGEEFAARGGSMMLYGPPGCGKTLVSEAIAHEAKEETDIEEEYGDVKFLEIKGGDVLSRYPGESERRIEAVFDQAHQVAQGGFAVLFFDEVETLIPDRSDDGLQRHERSLTNAFLQEMNDIEDNLLVIGATNMPFTIDPAATRRFPIQQFIPQPDAKVMSQVWEVNLRSLPNADDIDFERLGEASVGYTPAEIADRVLGSDLQREFVESIVDPDRDPITPDTEYLLEWLDDTEPKTVRQYVSSVREQLDDLEGYPEMQRYIEDQAEEHGISLGRGGGGGLGDLLASAAGGDSSESPPADGDGEESGDTPEDGEPARPPAGGGNES
ncbi:ATP-binding protein [Halorussus amylolyticus]|uniref:ATP-binding protein n=1 Tax=Halorussus amylolyticus TaxID=1126242 RepID=UPI001EE45FFC|nr:ATP-binding protein [Halorussus amylolyticus]